MRRAGAGRGILERKGLGAGEGEREGGRRGAVSVVRRGEGERDMVVIVVVVVVVVGEESLSGLGTA